MRKFSRRRLFVLNSTSRPSPEPESSPASAGPAPIMPSIYRCVIMTDEAQFGIRPMSAAAASPSTGSESSQPETVFSPIIYIMIFIASVATKINNVIWSV